ncbi:MAG: 6-pyruvoyl trahydropterin synthase family protein [Pseudonocardia sp.]
MTEPAPNDTTRRFRSAVITTFPAAHSLHGLPGDSEVARSHGHDYRATFVFETTTLVYPGVVIDDRVRAEITEHVDTHLAYRDLDQLFDRPATCEAIAEHLANWFARSAGPAGTAWLVSVAVTAGSGDHGEIHLPHPGQSSAPRSR